MNAVSSRSVLVLGARGRLGLAATRAFAADGWRVIAHARPGAAVTTLPGVTWVHCDVSDQAALVSAARGASVLVHALNPVYTAWDTQAMPLLEAGLRVADALQARLMLPGNVYNFGTSMPALLSEDTPQRATTRKGQIRIVMEQRLARAAQDGAVKSVVIRAGDFFGSGSGTWFDRALVKNINHGKFTYPGALDVPSAWSYLPDLASAFVRLANRCADPHALIAPFDVFHFQGHALTGSHWLRLLEGMAHEQRWLADRDDLRVASLPWKLIRIGGVLVPMWRELAEMQYLWDTPHALSGAKLAALIGLEPRTPLSRAVCTALQGLGLVGATGCGLHAWA